MALTSQPLRLFWSFCVNWCSNQFNTVTSQAPACVTRRKLQTPGNAEEHKKQETPRQRQRVRSKSTASTARAQDDEAASASNPGCYGANPITMGEVRPRKWIPWFLLRIDMFLRFVGGGSCIFTPPPRARACTWPAAVGCYTEKAPNAWQRRGTQKTRNTYNQPNRPNWQTAQTKHRALPKGQPGRRVTTAVGCHRYHGVHLHADVATYIRVRADVLHAHVRTGKRGSKSHGNRRDIC